MKRLRLIALIPGLLVAAIIIYALLDGDHLLPRHMGEVESLQAPVALIGWTDAGLQTTDGRTIPVPGIEHLPADSLALAEATKRGVEIAPDGRLICLIRIFHWCGNDPITADIRRVDLSDMLTYLRVGEPVSPVPNPVLLAREPGGWFHSDSGWSISDYFGFQIWQSEKSETFKP